MRYLIFSGCLLLVLISCKQEKKTEEKREVATYSIEQFMDNEAVFGGSFSPDNSKLLVTSNRSGIFNMYTVPTSGGEFTPVTDSDSSSVYAISFFPNDDRILFRMDDNGDEVYKIFVKDGDSITRLTPAENARALFYGWTKDRDAFYYGSNERDPRYTIFIRWIWNLSPRNLLYENSEAYDFGGVSPNGRYIALAKSINTNDSNLILYDTEQESYTQINTTQSGNSPQDFSEDNRYLFYTTDVDGEFAYLMKYDIENESSEKVLKRDWDIVGMGFSENGTYRVVYINEDAANGVEVINNSTGEELEFPEFENAFITGLSISRDEEMAILNVGGSHTPTNLYSYNMETGETTKLTDVLNKDINQDDLVTAEVIRYDSFDGVEIPAIYYKPHNAGEDNKVPALVWVHGGPGGQSRQNFQRLYPIPG
jgi:dipeptidyl aminopeptidase/acylaminoacyl peptidase